MRHRLPASRIAIGPVAVLAWPRACSWRSWCSRPRPPRRTDPHRARPGLQNRAACRRQVRLRDPSRSTGPPSWRHRPRSCRVNLPDYDVVQTMQNVALFGLISLAPVALLDGDVIRADQYRPDLAAAGPGQSSGARQSSPDRAGVLADGPGDVPGGRARLSRRDRPLSDQRQLEAKAAWAAGSRPIKAFMVHQIVRYKHEDYLQAFHEYAVPPSPGRVEPAPAVAEDFPLRVVAPAFLLSELTTAFMIGFYLYLPFLVIDLVVSSVLAATGLFMLPPTLVAMPVKLIVFVLADGWMLVATMLLSSFSVAPERFRAP